MNFKQFSTSDNQWHDIPYYIHKTATDTLSLPAVIYPNDTSITVGFKGNTTQSGTPSPSNPVDVVGVGELETSGEHAGQYKIPISMGGTTNNVYLGEVQTTRKIYKLVLDGTEDWKVLSSDNSKYYLNYLAIDYLRAELQITYMCTHYIPYEQTVSATLVPNLKMSMSSGNAQRLYIADANFTTTDQFKAYLAAQYAAGTPVTIWYVLAEPTTTTLNEPLMKIGTYADSLTTSIPCTAGENTLDVQTTVQPSEVTAGFSGWHPAIVHERTNGAWT